MLGQRTSSIPASATWLFITLASSFGQWPASASAHLALQMPMSRYGQNVLKQPPCGRTGGTRSQNVTTFQAGETITVTWNEYIDHPGHYRISFDADGDDDFVDPVCLSGCNSRSPVVEMNSNAAVLMDGIADRNGGDYSVTVTLPNVACTNCTLQVIQVMYDKPPYTLPGDEMYYQCADLILVGGDPVDAGVSADGATPDGSTAVADAGTEPEDDSGCSTTGRPEGSHTTALLLVFIAATSVARRRRR